MDRFKGTRGPWETEADAINSIAIISSELEVCSVTANNEDDLLTELEWANARLVASAPDLLEALELLVHYYMCEQEGIGSGQPSGAEWYAAVDKASAAINKALGEDQP